MSKNKITINPQDLSKKDRENIFNYEKQRRDEAAIKKEKRNQNIKNAINFLTKYGPNIASATKKIPIKKLLRIVSTAKKF